MVSEVRFHCGRDAQRLVNPAEIVIGEVQAVRGPQVFPLLGEGVRLPGQTAHGYSDCEVLAFYVARANLRGIGIAHDWDLLRVGDFRRAVPALAFGVGRVDLDELREVATVAESGCNRAQVGLEAIGADLEALRGGGGAKALNEGVGGGLRATAKSEVENEFSISLDGYEAVGVTDAVVARFERCLVSFLLLNEGPDFIALNVTHGNIHDQFAREFFTFLAARTKSFINVLMSTSVMRSVLLSELPSIRS